MNYVLDPSVVIKWYIPEVLSDSAILLKSQFEDGSNLVAVPRFFFVECANVLWKKALIIKELPQNDAKGIYSRILDLPFQVLEDDGVILKAMNLALRHQVSVYDGIYLASALYCGAIFVTADLAFIKKLASSELKKHTAYLADLKSKNNL